METGTRTIEQLVKDNRKLKHIVHRQHVKFKKLHKDLDELKHSFKINLDRIDRELGW